MDNAVAIVMATAICAMSNTALDYADLARVRNIALDRAPHTVNARIAVAAVVIANCIRHQIGGK